MSAGPKRLPQFAYVGRYSYFVTCCTHERVRVFVAPAGVTAVLEQMLRTADEEEFAVSAYCFMPDHLHALFRGMTVQSDFRRLMTLFRRRAAHVHARVFRGRLWQAGYYEHVLRDGESPGLVARYILANPVRGGLAATPGEYPYCRIAAELSGWADLDRPLT